jgi:hypothetical protein
MTVSELVQRLVKGMNEGAIEPTAEVVMVDGLPVFVDLDRGVVYITDVDPNEQD